MQPDPEFPASLSAFVFFTCALLFGAFGEEMLFRGYAFQTLIAGSGPFSALLPTSLLFAFAHAGNQGISWLGLINTFGFGLVLGYAYIRSRDLWLPIGIHFGWNWALVVFGLNVSGFKMGVTGFVVRWRVSDLWSGGSYGPEASVLTCGIIVALISAALPSAYPAAGSLRRLCMFRARLMIFFAASALLADQLTPDERIEILRGMLSEYATAKTFLPKSKKPLPFKSTGQFDKNEWQELGKQLGPAARPGDLVQVTKVDIDDDKIVLEINGGAKGKRKWYRQCRGGYGKSDYADQLPAEYGCARRNKYCGAVRQSSAGIAGVRAEEDACPDSGFRETHRDRTGDRITSARSSGSCEGKARHRRHGSRPGDHGARQASDEGS